MRVSRSSLISLAIFITDDSGTDGGFVIDSVDNDPSPGINLPKIRSVNTNLNTFGLRLRMIDTIGPNKVFGNPSYVSEILRSFW